MYDRTDEQNDELGITHMNVDQQEDEDEDMVDATTQLEEEKKE